MQDKSNVNLSRRNLLQSGGATLVAMQILPGGLILGANNAWAATPTAIKPQSFATLVQACRDIYPHDDLADSFYAKVVTDFDTAAATNAEQKKMLDDGAASLDQAAQSAHNVDYNNVGWEIQRVAILKGMQDSAIFQKMRGALVTGIYNNPEVWAIYGYQGESASKGGYINRGFDDIDWLDRT